MVGWTGTEFRITDLGVQLLERECLTIEEINRLVNLADIETRARRAARRAISQAEFLRNRPALFEDC